MAFETELYDTIQKRVKSGYKAMGYPVYDLSKKDIRLIHALANKYGFDARWLSNLISFETAGTFSPKITNSIGATGLIQFLPSTAKDLGVTTDILRKMTFAQQLSYVDLYLSKYFNGAGANKGIFNKKTGKVTDKFTQTDLFMIIFYPLAVGRPDFIFPQSVQSANAGISKPSDYKNRALAASTAPFKNAPEYISKAKVYANQNKLPIILVSVGFLALGVTGYLLHKNGMLKFKK
jgi:hypothetical protein